MIRTLTVIAAAAALLGVQAAFAAVDSPSCFLSPGELERIWGGQDSDPLGASFVVLNATCANSTRLCTDVEPSQDCVLADSTDCPLKHCWRCHSGPAFKVCEHGGPGCTRNFFATPCGSLESSPCTWGGSPPHCQCATPGNWTAEGNCPRSDCK